MGTLVIVTVMGVIVFVVCSGLPANPTGQQHGQQDGWIWLMDRDALCQPKATIDGNGTIIEVQCNIDGIICEAGVKFNCETSFSKGRANRCNVTPLRCDSKQGCELHFRMGEHCHCLCPDHESYPEIFV